MIGVHTRRVVAAVADEEAARNKPVEQLPHESMGTEMDYLSVFGNDKLTITALSAGFPNPTGIRICWEFDLPEEPINDRDARIVLHREPPFAGVMRPSVNALRALPIVPEITSAADITVYAEL